MFERLYAAYLLLQVMNEKPSAHRPAMNKLIKKGVRVAMRVYNTAMNNEMYPYRIAATFGRKKSLVSNLPSDEATKTLKWFLEDLSREIQKMLSRRKRFGEILVASGVEAWQIMVECAERYPDDGYTMTAYHIMPQFVHQIPVDYFVEAALNHPNEAIRSQAIICLQKYENVPQKTLDQISFKYGGLLQAEDRYSDLLYNTVVAVLKTPSIGIDTIFACWYSTDSYLKKTAIRAMQFKTDAGLFDRFVDAVQSNDVDICIGGLRGVAISERLAEVRTEVVQMLLSRFDKEATSEIRCEIIRMLGMPTMIQNDKILLSEQQVRLIVDKLLAITASDMDATIRQSAIRTLSQYAANYEKDTESFVSPEMFTKIVAHFTSIIDSETETSVWYETVLALGRCGEPRAVELLKSLLKELEDKTDEASYYLTAEASDLLEILADNE